MQSWNVVITTRPYRYQQAQAALGRLGRVRKTGFFDVLVMEVDHPELFADSLRELASRDPSLPEMVARAIPCDRTFDFQTVGEFEEDATRIARSLASEIGGRSFYVRVHRRGFRDRLHAAEEERRIGETLIEALGEAGTPGVVDFERPDVVVDIEIVGQRAGIALIPGEQVGAFPFGRVG